jgi:hypothetical protein
VALLVTPDVVFAPSHTHLLLDVRQLCIDWELLDPHEANGLYFRLPQDYKIDLRINQERWKSLKDAPKASDCLMFPCRENLKQSMEFNRACWRILNQRLGISLADDDWIREACADCETIYSIYNMAFNAACTNSWIYDRRKCLMILRDRMLGPEDYYAGILPPPIPLYLLREIK